MTQRLPSKLQSEALAGTFEAALAYKATRETLN